jgi:capsular exopolysaccharide synthesis family protein
MSRIQNILNKAERDGTVRRMRSMADPVNGSSVATVDAAPPPPPVPVAAAAPVAAATAVAPIAPIVPPPIVDEVAATAPAPTVARSIPAVHLAPTLVAALAPDAVTAEQYRALRTRVVHSDNGLSVHMLLVTSPGRGEGKSVTAANLALTMAQEYQQRICLVDANLRDPEIHRLFDIAEAPGLADVLLGRASLEDALVTIEDHHITVLPAGDPAAHPAELLGTVTMRRTLDALRSHFDRVIIDAPAASPLADIGILTPLVDSVMLVVRAGVTSKPAIQDAMAAIEPGKLLGVVLNETV